MTNNLIVKMIFGSHLYGTATEDSDKDFKGVFLPSKDDLLLGRVPKVLSTSTKKTTQEGVKNGADDVDTDIYSLPYFIDMACRGETVAMDMLHAGPEHLKAWSEPLYEIWLELRSRRHRFYSKNVSAFVGYCRKQAAKYGIKGSRLAAMEEVIDELETLQEVFGGGPDLRLKHVWSNLPTPEHVHILPPNPKDRNAQRLYQVCGKKFIENASLDGVITNLQDTYARYGERARAAKRNEGIDWKAVSHALRAAYQVESLFTLGGWSYPLQGADFLTQVKLGQHDYTTVVAPTLESTMARIERLAATSYLPKKVDRSFWDQWLLDVYDRYVLS